MSGFSDVVEPTSLLTAPKQPEEFSQGAILDTFNTCSDLMSPTYWVTEAYNAIFGFNPLDEAVQWFAGDWESFSKCGDLWGQLAKASEAVSQNIGGGNKQLDATWDGNAADAAYNYFTKLARALADSKESLDKLKTEYEHLSHAAYSTAEAISGFLGGIIDGLLITAIEMAAGTALSWTGVGAVVGYGLAGLEIANILRLWSEATSAIGNAQGIVNGGIGVVETIGATLYGTSATLPEVGQYDHPDNKI
jgi:hypothetical protein